MCDRKKEAINKLKFRKQKLESMQESLNRIRTFLVLLCTVSITYMLVMIPGVYKDTHGTNSTPVIVAPLHRMINATVTLKVTSDQLNPWMPTDDGGNPNYITWMGSGVVIDQFGSIITANHVVEGAKSITVIDYDGNEYEAVYFTGCEYADLGMVYIKPPTPLPIVSLAEANAEVGDTIYICGSSLGEFTNSLSKGIVGYPDRLFEDTGYSKPVFQSDASAYPGNSGGPVYNIDGQIVGILVAGVDSGMCFAVPVDQVRAFYNWCLNDRLFRELSCPTLISK